MTQPSKPSPEEAKNAKAEAGYASDTQADTGSSTPTPSSNAATNAASVDPSGSAASGADTESDAERIVAEAEAALEGEPEEASTDELVAKARAEADAWQDKYLRLHAEWDTYRRRTADQREVEKARAAEKLVTSLLPVIDDFERTIDYATNNGEAGLFEGVKAVHTKFVDVLSKDGVEIIDPKGQAFDALEAQAVATVDDTSVPDETVAEVYQKGYKLGSKVLRPAMVTVTTGGPKREKDPDEGAEK